MTENYHHVNLTIEQGELRSSFTCTAPEDADCRRRPPNIEETGQESWTNEQATVPGYPCWAREWVEAVGVEDAIIGGVDQVLASVPVSISYAEGVEITPVTDRENGSER
jgi:hypothetical protein